MTLRHYALPEVQRRKLKEQLRDHKNLRIIEVHNGISALVASEARSLSRDVEFDGFWVSSLTCSASRGLPDMELYVIDRRLELVSEVASVTSKPIIVDGDTGGDKTMLKYYCNHLEALGVSAIVVEDKKHPKRNSLSTNSDHILEDPDMFVSKIQWAKQGLMSDDFMIFARIESLIANQGMADALGRARTYLLGGVDGIMIHSKSKSPDEVYEFMEDYQHLCHEIGHRAPVMCVPTTYGSARTTELFGKGIRIVVYANHLLRAAHSAMQHVCEDILQNDHVLGSDSRFTSVTDLFQQVGYSDEILEEAVQKAPISAVLGR